ncbi:MAG: 6-pyruvoyl trahydropterin synthase family protein [Endomicrobiales bacterium]
MSEGIYTVSVKRAFDARHFLAQEQGPESRNHAHHYEVRVRLEGGRLDRRGYLVDIRDIERALEESLSRFRGKTLNRLAEFKGINPSIENLSRILCSVFHPRLPARVRAVTVAIAEENGARASYRYDKRGSNEDRHHSVR